MEEGLISAGWEWNSAWVVDIPQDLRGGADPEGWEYSTSFGYVFIP